MTPRKRREYVVFGFGSTHDALAAEAALKEGDVDAAVIPAPRALGSLCGIAIRVLPRDGDATAVLLAEARISPTARAVIEDV